MSLRPFRFLMRPLLPAFAVLLVLPFLAPAQVADPLMQLRVDVVYLASDDLEGRQTGSRGELLAAHYIARRMESLGLRGAWNGEWLQPFPYAAHPHGGPKEPGTGHNVAGLLDRKAKITLVIGAHFDHLGFGMHGSLHAADTPAIHNGADDNASGVAALLWLAREFSIVPDLGFNVLFVAFSGEEMGLLGSKAFLEKAPVPTENMLAMINMDMVGRLNAERSIAISGTGTASEWKNLLDTIRPDGFHFNYSESGIGPSDHSSFYLKNIPVLHFFTGQHRDYHKPSDDSPLVNYEGIREVGSCIRSLVLALSAKPSLQFQKTRDENKQQAAAFKVTLGVMPDYVYTGEGMRIDAVIENRPAHKAGLMDGDIVVRIGSYAVKDVYAYMEALSKFEKGQSTEIAVRRKDEVVVKTVTF